jgi:two-component system, NarL family, response regulator DevR
MRTRVKVFLLAGHRLLREALGRALGKRTDMFVVGESPVLSDVASLVAQSEADVLLLDAFMSHSANLQLLNDMRRLCPGTKVLMIGMEEDERMFLETVQSGVAGYLFKDASAIEVVAAIRAVAAGEAVCPSRLCMTLFKAVAGGKAPAPSITLKTELRLTRREQDLVPLIAQGLTNRQIASQLNLSQQTIKNHVHRMLRKIGVDDRLGVAQAAKA